MKSQIVLSVFVSMIVMSGNVLAYGMSGGSSANACSKPVFSAFVPASNSVVTAGSGFSFTASAVTKPKSIRVTVRDQATPVTVTPNNQGFKVTGKLPAALKGGFARITITAESTSKCSGTGGWLVKVAE